MSLSRVGLPEPLAPTIAARVEASTLRSRPLKPLKPVDVAPKEKATPRKSMPVRNQPVSRVHKSFLGDDAAVLAKSSGQRSAPPRRRAGVASMARRAATI